MDYYAGLDVSLIEVSICVVDAGGRAIARGVSPADPESVAGWFRTRSLSPGRIVHESGQLSVWLQRGLERLGLPATCIDARKAHKSLSAGPNKSDAACAERLAQLARTGWFTPVHVRSEESDRLRSLISARAQLISLRKDRRPRPRHSQDLRHSFDRQREGRTAAVAGRLMTIPGVGPIASLSFVALVDNLARFRRTGNVGAFRPPLTASVRRNGLVRAHV